MEIDSETNTSLDILVCVGKSYALISAEPHGIFISKLHQLLKFLVVSGIQSLMYRLYGRMHIIIVC